MDLEEDTIVPIYPRKVAKAVCAPAVRGEVAAADTTNWRGVRGLVVVRADALVTGLDFRDTYARTRILETLVYPDIRFEIDSLTNVQRGDTLRATAVGMIELHGVKKPMTVPIKVWREKLGLRVTGQWEFPAIDLINEYHMSPYPLSLGVKGHIWREVYLGIDAILVPASAAASSGS